MQTLKFEAAWDKTISPQDRTFITEVFEEVISTLQNPIEFTTLWEAKNYKGELLVTVLIHNYNDNALTFENTTLAYYVDERLVSQHTFNHPSLSIDKRTSMPWTFIFPTLNSDLEKDAQLGEIKIIISE